LHPSSSLGYVWKPDVSAALVGDALCCTEHHGAVARVWRERIDLLMKVKMLALNLPVRDAIQPKPPLRFFLRFYPTHPGRLAGLTMEAS
jgi:hypothetical protein